ncbi:hypothetical protein Ga0080559_TMP3409 [Salipiger profundus]|uniref:Uncharacterized protein n=1 Tax=Salipiger profundus TaxID=1229727 RepID=A0A1U7D813_9RHOB|nr:hypothetical protein Ga0080559_TMP3409 [Salipiger profundus]
MILDRRHAAGPWKQRNSSQPTAPGREDKEISDKSQNVTGMQRYTVRLPDTVTASQPHAPPAVLPCATSCSSPVTQIPSGESARPARTGAEPPPPLPPCATGPMTRATPTQPEDSR